MWLMNVRNPVSWLMGWQPVTLQTEKTHSDCTTNDLDLGENCDCNNKARN